MFKVMENFYCLGVCHFALFHLISLKLASFYVNLLLTWIKIKHWHGQVALDDSWCLLWSLHLWNKLFGEVIDIWLSSFVWKFDKCEELHHSGEKNLFCWQIHQDNLSRGHLSSKSNLCCVFGFVHGQGNLKVQNGLMQNNIMLSLFTFNLKFLLKNIKFKFIFLWC